MADERIGVSAILAASEGAARVRPTSLAAVLDELVKAIDRASLDGSKEITWLAQDGKARCAIVPWEWALAIREFMKDPGGWIVQRMAEQYRERPQPPQARPRPPADRDRAQVSREIRETAELMEQTEGATGSRSHGRGRPKALER